MLPLLGTASFLINSVSGSSYDQDKHALRMRNIEEYKLRSLQGDFPAWIQLRCWAGEKTPEAVAYNYVSATGVCRIGDDVALAAAKAAVAEVRLRQTVGPAAANAGVTLLGAANVLSPGTGTAALTGVVGSALSNFWRGTTLGLPTPAVILGAGVLVFFAARMFGRRR